ncbi:hypothetical protein M7I_5083 [Glarea lozoyensis 74030]|uniref:Uncharacterized protein n=1 Tax=Glarea lozoyensis (strain ATCC 74030 / MF5533) TaxID=1104152 RepID=H0EQX4_GLAL7|nr:hypothetical protein M7I_5083 [Glarea lozoyensis 74030]
MSSITASVVQWLGFHPSKVEVRVRFTAVALCIGIQIVVDSERGGVA